MMSGMPLETCLAFNKFWNNKFYYKVASCWLFLLIRPLLLSTVTKMWGYPWILIEHCYTKPHRECRIVCRWRGCHISMADLIHALFLCLYSGLRNKLVLKLVTKFPTFEWTRNFATNFTIALTLFLSSAWWNMSSCFHHIPVRYISTLLYHPRLDLVSVLFPSDSFFFPP